MKRREYLAITGGATIAALSGCLDSIPTLATVTPFEKRVSGLIEHESKVNEYHRVLERRYYTKETGPEYLRDPESPLEKPSPDEPFFLDDETYSSLKSQYDELTIHMHVCGEGLHSPEEYGCNGPQISRDNFNKFTLADELLIRNPSNSEDAHVYRVYDGEAKRD